MKRYGVGKVGTFDPKNAHAGVCWGWPKECKLTNKQAGAITRVCWMNRHKKQLTYPMMQAIRKSLAYAWELRGGEKSKTKTNFSAVGSNWSIVRENKCPANTMSQKPNKIPTPMLPKGVDS